MKGPLWLAGCCAGAIYSTAIFIEVAKTTRDRLRALVQLLNIECFIEFTSQDKLYCMEEPIHDILHFFCLKLFVLKIKSSPEWLYIYLSSSLSRGQA